MHCYAFCGVSSTFPQSRITSSLLSRRETTAAYLFAGDSSNMATAVDQKLLRQTKFPPEFNQKVDMKKVNVEVMKK